jgi:hypothetical protein
MAVWPGVLMVCGGDDCGRGRGDKPEERGGGFFVLGGGAGGAMVGVMSAARWWIIFCLTWLLADGRWLCAAEQAEEILAAARMAPAGVPVELEAALRAGSTRVPFRIESGGGEVRYRFDDPAQVVVMRPGEVGVVLEEAVGGGEPAVVEPRRMGSPVRGGLITYEDLALEFLWWPGAKVLGEERVRVRDAWRLEIPAPAGGGSRYGVVRVWVDKGSGALLRMEGYDREGRLVKRFEVVSAQRVEGVWMLKSMRVERIDPETRKTLGRMYLEVEGKADEGRG